MIVVMISAPFFASTYWEVTQNIRWAEALALEVALDRDLMPVLMHTMYKDFCDTFPREYWNGISLELLKRSDVLLMEKGWPNSQDCVDELNACKAVKKPHFYSIKDLIEWKAQLGNNM
jgi:hypothetical protein